MIKLINFINHYGAINIFSFIIVIACIGILVSMHNNHSIDENHESAAEIANDKVIKASALFLVFAIMVDTISKTIF